MTRRILSTLTPELTMALERELLRRNDVHLITARSIAELTTLMQGGVELCLVEALLPDGDALDALDTIRQSPQLSRVPVVLVTPRDAPTSLGVEDGFDAVVQVPDPDGAIDAVLGRLLGAIRRGGERRPASARVRDASGAPLGRVVDLARGGLALRTRRTPAMGEVLALSIDLAGHTAPLTARARVVRIGGDVVALALEDPSAELTAALAEALAPLAPAGGLSFRPTPALGEGAAAIAGRFVDGPAFSALSSHVRQVAPMKLALRGLSPFDEAGVDLWIALLAHASKAIELLGCPAWFAALAGRIPAVLGRGAARAHVASVEIPMRCLNCHDELEDEASWPIGDRARAIAAVTATTSEPCYICGGSLALEEPLEVMTAFLDA